MSEVDATYASPAYRDGFLSALDRRDGATLARLARDMTGCGMPLPSTVCAQLGIPAGSTYGLAARRIVAGDAEGWLAPAAGVAAVQSPPQSSDATAAQ